MSGGGGVTHVAEGSEAGVGESSGSGESAAAEGRGGAHGGGGGQEGGVSRSGGGGGWCTAVIVPPGALVEVAWAGVLAGFFFSTKKNTHTICLMSSMWWTTGLGSVYSSCPALR